MSSTPSKSSTNRLFYPLFIDISDMPCVVVGGGAVAERKIRMLLRFGAMAKVISPKTTRGLSALSQKGVIEVIGREYEDGDLTGAVLVIAATSMRDTNTRVCKEARRKGIWVNVVDDPELCDFIVPSIVRKKSITVAISTGGASPILSRMIRKDLEKWLAEDYGRCAHRIGRFRRFLIQTVPDGKRRGHIMRAIGRLPVKELARHSMKDLKDRFLGDG